MMMQRVFVRLVRPINILSQHTNGGAVTTGAKIIPVNLQYITHPSAFLHRAHNRVAV